MLTILSGTITTSFSRYESVSFPVFVFLGLQLNRHPRIAPLALFAVGQLFALRAVIRYQWLG